MDKLQKDPTTQQMQQILQYSDSHPQVNSYCSIPDCKHAPSLFTITALTCSAGPEQAIWRSKTGLGYAGVCLVVTIFGLAQRAAKWL